MNPSTTAASPGWIRRTLIGGLLVGISVLVALLLLEGALRLFPSLLPEEAQLRLSWDTEHFEQNTIDDPYLGFRYPPNRTITHRTHDFEIQIQTDEHGFRNASPWPAQAQTVVVGDSMAYGYGVPVEDSWSRRVGQSLAPGALINLSLPGTGPEQSYRLLKTYGAPLHPQLVIYCIFPANDIPDSRRFREWLASGSPSLMRWGIEHVGPGSQGFPKNVLERSYLALGMRSVRKNLKSRFTSQTLHLPGGNMQLAPSLYETRMGEYSPSAPAFQSVVTAVRETKALTDELGAQLLVVIFPTKEEVYLGARGARFPDMVGPVKRALVPGGYDVLDLTEGLRKHAGTDVPPLYFEVDGHLNTRGNAVAAELILEKLQNDSSPEAMRTSLHEE